MVEVNKGFLRIGEEMDWSQEFLKEWFYTCFMFGTMVFMWVYFVLWNIVMFLQEYLGNYFLKIQEPPCDLELDDDEDYSDDEFQDPATEGGRDDSPRNTFDDYTDYANVGFGGNSGSGQQRSSEPQNYHAHNVVGTEDSISNGSWEDIPNNG